MKRYLMPALLLLACNTPQPVDTTKPITDTIAAQQPVVELPAENGLEQLRTPDGKVSMEGSKRNGKRHGVWTSYTMDGRVKSKNTYADGLLHGESVVFRESGQLYYTGRYENGKEAGEWKFYGPDGALEKTVVK